MSQITVLMVGKMGSSSSRSSWMNRRSCCWVVLIEFRLGWCRRRSRRHCSGLVAVFWWCSCCWWCSNQCRCCCCCYSPNSAVVEIDGRSVTRFEKYFSQGKIRRIAFVVVVIIVVGFVEMILKMFSCRGRRLTLVREIGVVLQQRQSVGRRC